MIAYNHYIKFIPELENDEKIEGSYEGVITVKENKNVDFNNKLRCLNNSKHPIKNNT